jgi:hypothetical protein
MERPNFEPISIILVRCDIKDPKTCQYRSKRERRGVKNFYCWHPDSPEPDHKVSDARYRKCVTGIKMVET